jgi:hypothetical protein
VLTILYDYFNKVYFNNSVFVFICKVYDGIYLPKLGKLTYSKVSRMLYHYNTAVRFRLGLLTQDQLRTYIAGLNPVISLPSDITPLIRMSVYFSCSLLINKNINNLLRLKDNFIDLKFTEIEDRNFLKDIPLINGLNNFLVSVIERLTNLKDESDPVLVLDGLSGICLPDIDPLVLQLREVKKRTIILDKVWKESNRFLVNYDPDKQMFGSAIQTEVEPVNMSGHLRVSLMNLQFTVNSIQPFVKGE